MRGPLACHFRLWPISRGSSSTLGDQTTFRHHQQKVVTKEELKIVVGHEGDLNGGTLSSSISATAKRYLHHHLATFFAAKMLAISFLKILALKNITVSHCLEITLNVALEFWHLPPIFVRLKMTCLVTLFDRKIQVFKNSPKWTFYGIFN